MAALSNYAPTVGNRVRDGVQAALSGLGMSPANASRWSRNAAQALDWTPVGAVDAAQVAMRQGRAAARGGDTRGRAMAAAGVGLAGVPIPGPVKRGLKRAAEEFGELAMDEASRMARAKAMGFTREVKHGANAAGDWDALLPSANGELGPGIYTGNADRANFYAKVHPRRPDDHGAVFPLLIKEGPYADEAAFDAAVRKLTDAPLNSAEEMAARIEVVEDLKRQGYIGVRGDQSHRGLPGEDSDYSVFDPANVRSKFAAFDPRKAKSGNLLAGIGAGALVAPGLMDGIGDEMRGE